LRKFAAEDFARVINYLYTCELRLENTSPRDLVVELCKFFDLATHLSLDKLGAFCLETLQQVPEIIQNGDIFIFSALRVYNKGHATADFRAMVRQTVGRYISDESAFNETLLIQAVRQGGDFANDLARAMLEAMQTKPKAELEKQVGQEQSLRLLQQHLTSVTKERDNMKNAQEQTTAELVTAQQTFKLANSEMDGRLKSCMTAYTEAQTQIKDLERNLTAEKTNSNSLRVSLEQSAEKIQMLERDLRTAEAENTRSAGECASAILSYEKEKEEHAETKRGSQSIVQERKSPPSFTFRAPELPAFLCPRRSSDHQIQKDNHMEEPPRYSKIVRKSSTCKVTRAEATAVVARMSSEKPPGNKNIQIFVRRIGGQTMTLEVSTRFLIDQIKRLIFLKTAVPEAMQRLTYCGKPLEDGRRTLADYNIGKDNTLILY